MWLQQFCYTFVQKLEMAELKMTITVSHISGFPYVEIEDRKSGFYGKYFTISSDVKDNINKNSTLPVTYSVYPYITKEDILNISKGDFEKLLEYRDCLKKMVKLLNQAEIPTCDYFNGNFVNCMRKAHTKMNRRLIIHNRDSLNK
jgi:hypothetical protein